MMMSRQPQLICRPVSRDLHGAAEQCQLLSMGSIKKKISWLDNLMQFRVNLLRPAKREAIFLKNRIKSLLGLKQGNAGKIDVDKRDLLPGDAVRVFQEDEIRSMLDDREKYKGCFFIDEMYQYCGNEYVVFKAVDHFFDEAKNRMCKCKNIYLLKGVSCSGKQRLYPVSCDRYCFFFWHKDWLTKIAAGSMGHEIT